MRYAPVFVAAALAVAAPSSVSAQVLRGGEQLVPGFSSADERLSQSDLWVMDVAFKPMRQIVVDITDPKTGEKKKERVWYLVYRAFNRPIEQREGEAGPVNQFDKPVRPPMFVPEFTLVTTDGTEQNVYQDTICPEAVAAINAREKMAYRNSVDIVGPVPPPAAPKSEDEQPLLGVAIFRGVDPDADRYTVYLTGFSNGIRKIEGPDGVPVVQHKTLVQKYWRPGDRFDQNEAEIRLDGEPQWIYR